MINYIILELQEHVACNDIIVQRSTFAQVCCCRKTSWHDEVSLYLFGCTNWFNHPCSIDKEFSRKLQYTTVLTQFDTAFQMSGQAFSGPTEAFVQILLNIARGMFFTCYRLHELLESVACAPSLVACGSNTREHTRITIPISSPHIKVDQHNSHGTNRKRLTRIKLASGSKHML